MASDGVVFGFFGNVNEDFNDKNTKSVSISDYENIASRETPISAIVIIDPIILSEIDDGNIAFVIYRDDALFLPGNVKNQKETDKPAPRFIINSNVISIAIGQFGHTTRKLAVPLKYSLAHKQVCDYSLLIKQLILLRQFCDIH